MFSLYDAAFMAMALSGSVVASPTPAIISGVPDIGVKGSTPLNPAVPIATLQPVSAAAIANIDFGLAKRQVVESTKLTEATSNVVMFYASSQVAPIYARINATMKSPSILLEDMTTITQVNCTNGAVNIKFANVADFTESASIFPDTGNFFLFTDHQGDCDGVNERGIYFVNKVAKNQADLSIIATAAKTTFENSTEEMSIDFTKPQAPLAGKRAVRASISASLPSAVSLFSASATNAAGVQGIDVNLDDASIGVGLEMSGHAHFTWWKFSFDDFYLDVDLAVAAAATVNLAATAAYNNEFAYSPLDLTVAPFSIPGILSVGPQLGFQIGVETTVSGSIDIASTFTMDIADGKLHLDLIDSAKTTTSGWTPVWTSQTNISAAAEAQLNPYVEVTAEVGVNFLNGLLDLSAGVRAKPILLNVWDIDARMDISNTGGVTFPPSTEAACINGMWFASSFHFSVTAFVANLYSKTLYDVVVPIYESGCWSWVTNVGINNNIAP